MNTLVNNEKPPEWKTNEKKRDKPVLTTVKSLMCYHLDEITQR